MGRKMGREGRGGLEEEEATVREAVPRQFYGMISFECQLCICWPHV